MGSVQNFFTSRDNNVDPDTYVGQLDRLWYNPNTNQLFVSDGVTPGGRPVDLGSNSNILVNTLTVSTIDSPSGTVQLTGNISISGNISPATATTIGGVRAGPGANIGNTGLLTIDTAGLPLSFGDFTANTNILTLVNNDQDMVLATQGSAEIQLVGNIGFYKSNGLPPDLANQYFSATNDGQITVLVTTTNNDGAVKIIGSSTGDAVEPGITGAMLHVTGQPDTPCRLYYDGISDYVSWVARRYNGTPAAPTQVLANQDVLRINATAATDAGVGNVAMAQIQFRALENQTTTAQGSTVNFVVTPVGSPATDRVQVANITVANGVSATKFTGNLTGNVTGTADTATDLAAATGILAGVLSVDPVNIAKTTASVQTFTLSGLTTDHNIVITSGTALGFGVIISAAFASAVDTLSIEFQNFSNNDINLPAKNIQYFAWI